MKTIFVMFGGALDQSVKVEVPFNRTAYICLLGVIVHTHVQEGSEVLKCG